MRLKVLFLTSWFPSRVSPRLGNFVFAHAEAVATVHEVTVAYITGDPEVKEIEIEQEILGGITIVRAYYPGKKRFTGRWRALKKIMAHLNMREGLFDIAQLNMVWNEGWQAVWLKKKYKLPFVISDNWTGYHPDQRGPLPFYIKRYMRWVANHSDLLVPVTEHLLRAMRSLGYRPDAMIVPNAVELSTFSVAPVNSERMRFLHLSHLDQEHKNIAGILNVWKRFSDQHPDTVLDIGGDGDWRYWKGEAEKLHISENSIRFFGALDRPQVAGKMKAAHCLVLFSNYENLPLVMIEAMACGLTVVATDVGGISEHIEGHQEHKLIAPRDEEALFNALEESLSNYQQVNRAAIRAYAVDHFGLDAVGKLFTKAYLRVLNR